MSQEDQDGLFHPSEATIRLQVTFESLLQEAAKQAQHAKFLQVKQTQAEQNVPLFGLMKQWIHALVGDVLMWVARREEEGPEPIVGIPVDEADAILSTLRSILEDTAACKAAAQKPTKAATRKIDELTLRMTKHIKEVIEVIEDFAIEETLDEDDEDFVFVDEEDELPSKPDDLFIDDEGTNENEQPKD